MEKKKERKEINWSMNKLKWLTNVLKNSSSLICWMT